MNKLLLVWPTGCSEGKSSNLGVDAISLIWRHINFRYGTYFGSFTAQVNFVNPDPGTWGIYAGSDGNKLTLVIVNKKPNQALTFDLSNVATGTYFVRHFGGAAGVAKWQVSKSVTLQAICLYDFSP